MRDTRLEYPAEYDEPDASDWEGSRLGDICPIYGISPAADCLRAIDRYGEEGATVSVKLPNGEFLSVPDDLAKIRALQSDEPVEAWVIHGIAWDGSDWEWSRAVVSASEIPDAIAEFVEALEDFRAFQDTENDDSL